MPHVPRNIQSPWTAADYWTQYGSPMPRMCTCILITPRTEFGGSSAAQGFTSNTRDMTLPGHPGITFYSAPGLDAMDVEQVLDDCFSLEVTGIYQSGYFTQAEIIAGKWTTATVEVFVVCWDNVNLGEFLIGKGYTGQITDMQRSFKAEVRGPLGLLANEINPVTSRICRAPEFGDPVYCKKDLTGTVTIGGTAYNITESNIPVSSLPTSNPAQTIQILTASFAGNVPPSGYYINGKATATSGANAGVSREISYYQNGLLLGLSKEITFKRDFPFPFVAGDTVTLVAGCNHTIEDCIKFGNIANRRAEDFIPGIEAITQNVA